MGMRFAKLHGSGNDFLLVEAEGEERDWNALAGAMCERHFGVGADGLMLVLPSNQAAVRMRLFNADGSEAEVSGNGVRCLVKYLVERGIVTAKDGRVTIEAVHGVLEAEVFAESGVVTGVRLSMGPPRFAPQEVPVVAEMQPPVLDLPLDVDGRVIAVSCLSMGNPHAVLICQETVESYPLEEIGPKVEHHPAFPERVNYGVARVVSRERMDVRVWERGVGGDAGLRQRLLRGDGGGEVARHGRRQSRHNATWRGADGGVGWAGRCVPDGAGGVRL